MHRLSFSFQKPLCKLVFNLLSLSPYGSDADDGSGDGIDINNTACQIGIDFLNVFAG